MQKKERRLLLILLAGILLAGGVSLYGGRNAVRETAAPETDSAVVQEGRSRTGQPVKVHVKGAVHLPGVYQLPENSRVADAVEAAGGAKEGADLDGINLAALLQDGGEVVLGLKGEFAEPGAQQQDGRINLNTASLEELDRLPGIGGTRAQAILDYRQNQGRFLSVDDLKKVQGFGTKLFEQVKDKIKVQ